MGGLPKQKRSQPDTTRLSPNDQKMLDEMGRILGCRGSISAVYQQLENKKATLNMLRVRLGLKEYENLEVHDIESAVMRLKEATALEDLITRALSSIPFKKATLVVSLARIASSAYHPEYEATLKARENRDREVRRNSLPFGEAILLEEPKEVVLDRNVADGMGAAVRGLIPAKSG